ncbi:MAG: DUF2017 family protein [Candidatus Dormibacteria bacterium]
MASIAKRRGRIQVKLDEQERAALASIVSGMGDAVPAPSRAAYDDPAMEAEYARWVRPEVAAGVHADLAVISDALSAGDDVLMLTEAQVHAFLRGFNHLRAVAGDRLGITGDGWEATVSAEQLARPEYGVLMALGWLQEELIVALDT